MDQESNGNKLQAGLCGVSPFPGTSLRSCGTFIRSLVAFELTVKKFCLFQCLEQAPKSLTLEHSGQTECQTTVFKKFKHDSRAKTCLWPAFAWV